MLIRPSGGTDGIKEYLEDGRKQGRELSRDELDTRLILDGNLAATNELIQLMDTDGERYLHITLAFKEDHIEQAMFDEVVNEFKKFAFAAYQPDEYSFYAEAHIPKIKSYINSKTGEFVERKPHIHIVIPKINLLNGQTLNPFGMINLAGKEEPNMIFIDALQESLNNKLGLASPKDNPRLSFTGESEMISRYAGDFFEGGNKDLKAKIFEAMLTRKIDRYDDFKALLTEFGETRSRNEGRANEYQNIKVPGADKGINLDGSKSGHFMFSRKFIEMPEAEKHALLTRDLSIKYEQVGAARKTSAELEATLKEWYEVRAKEIKYINSGNRKAYKIYRESSYEDRINILAGYEQRFNSKFREVITNERNNGSKPFSRKYQLKREHDGIDSTAAANNGQPNLDANRSFAQAKTINSVRNMSSLDMVSFDQGSEMLLQDHEPDQLEHGRTQRIDTLRRNSNRRQGIKATGRSADALPNQLLRDLNEQKQGREAEAKQGTANIIARLEANRLLADLSITHGVIPSKYEVTKGKSGNDRIKCGNRNLSVSDFLTKELQIPWADAEKILKASYQSQLENQPQQVTRQQARKELWAAYQAQRKLNNAALSQQSKAIRELEKKQFTLVKNAFYAKRSEAQSNKSLKPAARKAAISIARMERIEQEKALKDQFKQKRELIKVEQKKPYTEQYREYLAEQSQQGNETALAELRRMKIEPTEKEADSVLYIKAAAPQGNQTKEPINRLISYQVHVNGDVTYKRNGLDVLRDQGQRVQMLQTDDQSIETGLRLAQQKFGGKLTLTGSQEFQERTARIAAEQGIRVEFADPAINQIMQQRKAELAALGAREAQPVKPNVETGDLQASLAEAERIAKDKGYTTVLPGKAYYTGTILARTAHHIVQSSGKGKAVVHELNKLNLTKQQLLDAQVNATLKVNYRTAKPTVDVATKEQAKQHQKENER